MKKTNKNAESRFGYGEIKYHSENEFPFVLEYNGCRWYRTKYAYTFWATGMVNYLYDTDDRERDLRLYVDAAGNIWDEMERGIL